MSVNYYFLWNYNKFPLIYSIMKENERNILVINIRDSPALASTLSKLDSLEKIYQVRLIKNNFSEYILNVLYRVFIYPFKYKEELISFYLDGFVGHYPLFIANIGRPDNIFFYEEGESIYKEDVLFVEPKPSGLKGMINVFIKKVLFIKKSSIYNIKIFYVRDKKRLLTALRSQKNIRFEIREVDDVAYIRNMPEKEKEKLKKIFFNNFTCDFNCADKDSKKAIVLTQPIYLDNPYTKEESVELFNYWINKLIQEGYKVYLKTHPREIDDLYIKDNVERVNGHFPFELLALYDIEFDKGLTYNSTAVNSKLIKQKCLIRDELN